MAPSWTPSDDGFLAGPMLPTTCCPARTISPNSLVSAAHPFGKPSRFCRRRGYCKRGDASACGSAIATIGISSIRRFCPGIPTSERDEALITSLIEARRIIEPAAAALAAKRATAADLAQIEQAYLGMERNLRTNLEACCEADLKFHVSVIAASHNIVLKGLTGTIEAALRTTFAITNRLIASAQSRALSAHRAVFECVRMRDAEGARLATVELLEIAARDLDSERAGVARRARSHEAAKGSGRPDDDDRGPSRRRCRVSIPESV